MKSVRIAAAAVLLGSVSAEGWEGWSSSADPETSKTPTLDKTTTFENPKTTPSIEKATTSAVEEDSKTIRSRSTTSSDPVKITSTTASSEDPHTWSEWESTTSSTPAKITSTSSDPEHTWSEWESTTSNTPVKITSTFTDPADHTWSEWESKTSSTPAVATSTSEDPHTWSEWESTTSSIPVKITSTSTDPADHTWGTWDPTQTVTSTSTHWVTVTVYPNDSGKTWSEWDPNTATSSTPAVVTSTSTADHTWSEWDPKTSSGPAVVTSTVTSSASTSSSAVWSAWTEGACRMQVSLSYGPPVWFPTPAIASAQDPKTWSEWESKTSSIPAVVTSTSADPAKTWSEWESKTSSTPAVVTSTSTDPAKTWSEWESSTSSKPAVETSTSTDPAKTWSEWESSTSSDPSVATSTSTNTWEAWTQTDGGKFYTATGSNSAPTGSSSNTGADWIQSKDGISANGNKFGMTYSPYTASSQCKDQATVDADIAKIAAKGFTSVRVYSTDCSTLEFVGKSAREHGIKIILGVFISETGIKGAQPQVDAIAKWAQWDLVELIVVGNEAVFNNRCSASDLAGFIGSAKQAFKGAGYAGSISTTDELSIWQSNGQAWCDVVDVVTANLYAFFNPNTKAEDAGHFIQRQIEDLKKVCPGKEVYVMESGWPSAGECNGAACPSPENQAIAIKGIQQSSGARVVFFSFEDEQWKEPGKFGVEQHWGCGEVFN